MPIEPRIWHDDPPSSSYPACLAVKAAELQGRSVGERYLRRVREAVMLEQRNVARRSVLLELAEGLAAANTDDDNTARGIDLEAFCQTIDDRQALAAFRADLLDAKYREIGRFPTLIVRGGDARAVIIVGYRPYNVLLDALSQVVGAKFPLLRPVPTLTEYTAFWRSVTGNLTERELAEVCGTSAQRQAVTPVTAVDQR